MIWQLLQGTKVLFRGSYRDAIRAADRLGLISHLVVTEDDDGGRKHRVKMGRGYHPDGTELPPRIERGFRLVPEARRAVRGRAAA